MHLCSVQDFEDYAYKTLPLSVLDYYRGGSCSEETLRLNRAAFNSLRLRPKMLRDVSVRDTSTTVLGFRVKIPIGVSPAALQRMAHHDGEIGNARAVGDAGSIYILSTLSSTSIEDLAKGAPDTIKWFQLYIYKDRDLAKELVERAEAAGFSALVLTVDANIFGIRYADARNQFKMPSHLSFANLSGLKAKMQTEKAGLSGMNEYIGQMFDESITWHDIKWLKSITSLPIIVKGILTGEDAVEAMKHGASAIFVSNHGGRQLDTAPAAIEALPEVVKAVNGQVEVYFDGGVRHGHDAFKAIALGAKMVFVGRPMLWGLAHSGEKGAKRVLGILAEEFRNTMGLTGCNKLSDIKKEMVVHKSFYHKL